MSDSRSLSVHYMMGECVHTSVPKRVFESPIGSSFFLSKLPKTETETETGVLHCFSSMCGVIDSITGKLAAGRRAHP